MKKMKNSDIPDLIKTVKAKKLPREALKGILNKFSVTNNQITLNYSAENLKADCSGLYNGYVETNKLLSNSLSLTNELLLEKIKSSGLYKEPEQPKELVSTFKYNFSK